MRAFTSNSTTTRCTWPTRRSRALGEWSARVSTSLPSLICTLSSPPSARRPRATSQTTTPPPTRRRRTPRRSSTARPQSGSRRSRSSPTSRTWSFACGKISRWTPLTRADTWWSSLSLPGRRWNTIPRNRPAAPTTAATTRTTSSTSRGRVCWLESTAVWLVGDRRRADGSGNFTDSALGQRRPRLFFFSLIGVHTRTRRLILVGAH
mmetsp:Transcript_29863/g.102838  ORF Transcript_29863/g.102838 Transcript_29863/m.102838 type:complete len:207 (+) Transcript_29863:256-876(+)